MGSFLINKRKELVKELIREFDLKNTNDISSMFCEWMGDTIQEMLNSELDEELDMISTINPRRKQKIQKMAFFEKRMRSEYGDIHIKVPRDRNSEFELQIVKKYQKDLAMIEHQILILYAKGMSNREIEDFIKNMYGTEVSPSLISRITDCMLLEIREWQSRPFKRLYAMVFREMDRIKHLFCLFTSDSKDDLYYKLD